LPGGPTLAALQDRYRNVTDSELWKICLARDNSFSTVNGYDGGCPDRRRRAEGLSL
jgi:hypothetical protein